MDVDAYLRAASAAVSPRVRGEMLREARGLSLRAGMQGCRKCPLAAKRTQAVPWKGPQGALMAIVGEAPGAQEDREGKPFVGAAGKFLNRALESLGVAWEQVAMLNTVCCRPPHNRAPEAGELAACRGWFRAQLDYLDPLIVVLVGRSAVTAAFPDTRPQRMSQLAGQSRWRDGRVWWFTAHPAYHMRRGDLAGLISSLTLPAKYLEVVSRAQRPRFVPEIPCPQCGWPLNWHTLQRGKAHCARAEQSHDVGFGSKLKWQTTPSPFFDASMVAEALSYVRRVKDSSQQQEMFPE